MKLQPPTVLDASFIAEAREIGGLPAEGPPEIAIAGRSNVGKSTLINRLVARRNLARTSKTPGRTRGLIFYDLAVRTAQGERRVLRLVDMPGYGYAQVSHDERKLWQDLVERYVKQRKTLALVVMLVDARRPVAAEERQLFEWLASLGVHHELVFTKVDKLSAAERGTLEGKARAGARSPGPPVILASGQTGEGVDLLWRDFLRATAIGSDPAP